jgi:D-alanyl-lipoteichoic acid acyltransferase DltB (MBOAT superfamily)
MPEADLVRDGDVIAAVAANLSEPLRRLLIGLDLPPRGVEALLGLLQFAEGALLVTLLTAAAAALQGAIRKRPVPSRSVRAARFASMVLALLLLFSIVRSPSSDIFALIQRWDHLACSALAGCFLAGVPVEWRKRCLVAVSTCFLLPHTGVVAFVAVIGTGVLGFIALHLQARSDRRFVALAQGVILAALFWFAWELRASDLMQALHIQGLFAFVLLRHISFVVEVRGGRPAGLGNYLCYMLFYPCCIGATETYSEFHDRNLTNSGRYEYRLVARKLVTGMFQIWAAKQMMTTYEIAIASPTFALLWWNVLLMFVRSSIFLMGLWSMIDGVALFYGFELRPNFARILSRQNPSDFWHSWRATMTNWLIRYVYIPLGGNRSHQTRNIFAAFAVSTLWHWMGFLFLAPSLNPMILVPIGLWGLMNAAGVAAYARWRRSGWSVLPERTPRLLRSAIKILLTIHFGTLTGTLLGFTPQLIDLFPAFARTALGLGAGE